MIFAITQAASAVVYLVALVVGGGGRLDDRQMSDDVSEILLVSWIVFLAVWLVVLIFRPRP